MKLGKAPAIIALFVASSGVASAGTTWVVRNLALHTGIGTDEVVAVLGNRMDLTECQYAMHPSRRTEIQRLVVKGRDAMIAAQRHRRHDARPVSVRVAALDR